MAICLLARRPVNALLRLMSAAARLKPWQQPLKESRACIVGTGFLGELRPRRFLMPRRGTRAGPCRQAGIIRAS